MYVVSIPSITSSISLRPLKSFQIKCTNMCGVVGCFPIPCVEFNSLASVSFPVKVAKEKVEEIERSTHDYFDGELWNFDA